MRAYGECHRHVQHNAYTTRADSLEKTSGTKSSSVGWENPVLVVFLKLSSSCVQYTLLKVDERAQNMLIYGAQNREIALNYSLVRWILIAALFAALASGIAFWG